MYISESSVSSQLVIVLDTNPVWWGQASDNASKVNISFLVPQQMYRQWTI